MKKILTELFCLVFIFSMTACSGSSAHDKSAAQLSSSAKVTEVSTITEFLDAIAPGASIKLSAGKYNLSDAKGYGGKNVSDCYCWENLGDGSQFALIIEDIADLSIFGDNAEIVADSRWANVISFNHCDNLSLSGLKLGHSEGADLCEGGVIDLSSCDNVTIDNCDLYGCGSLGLNACQCWNLSISNTSVHHCSSGGINYSSGKHLKLDGCNIYECGKGDCSAWSCFSLSDTDDIHMSNCSVKDSRFSCLINGYFEGENITFENSEIIGNTFDSIFEFDGRITATGLKISENVINRWHDEYYNPVIILDGETYSDQKFNEIYGEQLSSKGLGTVNTEPAEINTEGTNVVHVSTADEFINAIASDTLIIIDSDEIDLSSAANYGKDAIDFWDPADLGLTGGERLIWQQVYDGYGLWIGNVTNLHIQGGKIVTQPRYANVISFWASTNISFDHTVFGHTDGSECAGGVIYLSECTDIIVESCELYGCGIYGIETSGTKDLYFQNNCIHDCSYGAASFCNSDNITCSNTAVVSCPSPAVIIDHCENFIWDNTLMASDCKFDPVFS